MNIANSISKGGVVSRNSSSSNDSKRQQNDTTTDKAHTLSQALSMDDEASAPTTTSSSAKNTQPISNFTILSISILTGGSLLGLLLPKNENLPSHSWQILSNVTGYTYFLAWSTSFYPQILLNHQRRLVVH
jgi:hypothetical protein